LKFFDERDNPAPSGIIDRFIRRFPALSHLLVGTLLFSIGGTALGLAFTPSIMLIARAWPPLWNAASLWRWPALGLLSGAALLLWGVTLLIIVPAFNFIFPTRLRASSAGYFTAASLPWYLHNGLFYLVRFTVFPFVSATPIGTLFLSAMGMHLGRRVRMTSENFTDVSMITLGDDVVIGGSATIFCHFGGAGKLVIAPVVIEARATIGEKATVMGDVIVGEGATILPHTVLLPGTRVGARERWGGVPGRPISREEWQDYKAMVRAPAPAAPEAASS